MVARDAKFYRPDEVPDEESNTLEPIKVAEWVVDQLKKVRMLCGGLTRYKVLSTMAGNLSTDSNTRRLTIHMDSLSRFLDQLLFKKTI